MSSWIEKIRKKSHAEKISLIWTIIIVTAIFLIALWVLAIKLQNTRGLEILWQKRCAQIIKWQVCIGRSNERDTKIFDTINNGIKDLKNNYGK